MSKDIGFVIDYETLGGPRDIRPILLDVAVTVFDFGATELPSFESLLKKSKKVKFSIKDQKESGRIANQATKNWWMNQDEEVRRAAMQPLPTDKSLREGHREIIDFLKQNGVADKRNVLAICRGQSFDFNLLEIAADDCGLGDELPYMFWNQMDTRSYLKGLFADYRARKFPIPKGWMTEGAKKHDSRVDCCKDVGLILYAQMLARGEVELDENKVDMW